MKNKKHEVLFLHRYFYPEYVTSASLAYDVAEALVKDGINVSVLCGYPKEYTAFEKVPTREEHNGMKIRRIRYIQANRKSFIGRLVNYFSFTIAVLSRLFTLRNYELIIVYSDPPVLPIVPALSSVFFKNKFVYVCYDVYPEIAHVTGILSKRSLIAKAANWVNNIVFRHVEKVVVLSSEMKEFLLKSRPTLLPEKVEIIPNWFESKDQMDSYDKEIEGKIQTIKSENTLVVGYFGNMGIAQDMDTLIEAARTLKNHENIKFLLAGHGVKMTEIKSIVQSEKLENVIILDFLHRKQFEEALKLSDCLVVSLSPGVVGLAVPSKTYSYMWAGRPIIAIMNEPSDITSELIQYNAGYWIKNGDVKQLVSVIEELYNNPEKRKSMGENAKQLYLQKYTKEKCTAEYVKLVKDIIGRE